MAEQPCRRPGETLSRGQLGPPPSRTAGTAGADGAPKCGPTQPAGHHCSCKLQLMSHSGLDLLDYVESIHIHHSYLSNLISTNLLLGFGAFPSL